MQVMLACAAPPLEQLSYPVLVSPKLDGVRCYIKDDVAFSRNGRPIPNRHVQNLFGHPRYNGLDGELIVGEPTAPDVFRKTMSGVMKEEGFPDVKFYVFDLWDDLRTFDVRYRKILQTVPPRTGPNPFEVVSQKQAPTAEIVVSWEEHWLAQGFEGLMIRDPDAPYKHGRSTAKEGYLLKLKRFCDSEAVVLGCDELMHNANEERTSTGRRSSKKAGMEGLGVLGALRVRDPRTGVEFDIGTGFSADQRAELWAIKDTLVGLFVTYKFFPTGSKEAPRFPVFKGFRDKRDL